MCSGFSVLAARQQGRRPPPRRRGCPPRHGAQPPACNVIRRRPRAYLLYVGGIPHGLCLRCIPHGFVNVLIERRRRSLIPSQSSSLARTLGWLCTKVIWVRCCGFAAPCE